MKHISILVPFGEAAVSCIEGPNTLFNKVNDFLADQGKEPLFTVQLVGYDRQPKIYQRLFQVVPDTTIDEVKKTDLIIIPAVNGDMEQVVAGNQVFYSWIKAQHNQGAEVASLCVGAFMLAGTGLLNGKKCSTHWLASGQFSELFPDVELVSDKVITDEHGIYSSGGANSFWNLLLYILEKYAGRDIAILASKYYEIEIGRQSQSPFIMFMGQHAHQDEVIRKAQEYIEQNLQDRITVEQLSSLTGLGRRSFERRFKKTTSNTVMEYIQRVKIEAAKKNLETGIKNVSEVMYDVGYNDTKAFRDVFRRLTGLSPVEYRNRYARFAC